MHELIASRFLDDYLVLRPGSTQGIKIPQLRYAQLTGGEPLIDRLFTEVYTLAFELGMMISISSNGSRLANPKILELLTSLRPYRLTLSV